ncbi:MAG: type II toxin-antitoxin system RelE/ParE family toxin [Methylococcaceae bacterium]
MRLILALLNNAAQLGDLESPALRLHGLKDNLEGFWSLTVQANWRVIFRFEDGNAYVVDYLDYH